MLPIEGCDDFCRAETMEDMLSSSGCKRYRIAVSGLSRQESRYSVTCRAEGA